MPSDPIHIDPTHLGSPSFPTTSWSQVLTAQGRDRGAALRALGRLIECYWHPVYFFLRHKGRRREEAKDLTQAFFTSFLEKDIIAYADRERGRFRSFLLTSTCRFLALKQRSSARLVRRSRGGDVRFSESAIKPDDSLGLGPGDSRTPEDVFMQNWARCFLDSCVAKLREECRGLGKDMQFRVFQLRFLLDRPHSGAGAGRLDVPPSGAGPDRLGVPPSGREIASRLGIAETDVTNYLHRAKERFRRIATKEMLNWVASPDEVEEEIRSLLALL